MNNNKQMKLYTELEIMNYLTNHRSTITRYDLQNLHHIELPSDEEIREERLLQFPDSEYANRANDRLAFYCGARMVINKIQGGNND